MKFGSDEWMEKLRGRVKFPARFIYYYDKKDNVITVRTLESKAKIENVRYQDIRPSALAFQQERDNAIIQVKEISSAEDYYDELVNLQEEWETEKY